MSIIQLENAPFLNVVVKSVTAGTHITKDIDCETLVCSDGAQLASTNITDDCIIQGTLQMGSSSSGKQYVLPSETGLATQVLALGQDNTTLEWVNSGGSGGSTNINAGANIVVNEAPAGTFLISVDSDLTNIDSLTVKDLTIGTSTFQQPSTGTTNQVLSLDSNKNMIWVNGGGGSSTVVQGSQNIEVSNVGNTYTVSTADTMSAIGTLSTNNISFNALSWSGYQVQQPINSPSNGCFLQVDTDNQTVNWVQSVPDGVQSVSAGNNIVVGGTAENPTVSLASTISNLTSVNTFGMIINDCVFPNPKGGTQNQVLTITDTNGTMNWRDNASTNTAINAGDPNVIVTENSTNNFTIDINEDMDINTLSALTIASNEVSVLTGDGGLKINQIGFPDPTNEPNGAVLTILEVQNQPNQMIWTRPFQDGVQSVSAGNNNIVVAGTAENPTVALSDDVVGLNSVATNSLKINSINFPDPTSGVSINDVLTINGSGNMVWQQVPPDGVQTVSSTNTNIIVSGTSTNPQLTLNNVLQNMHNINTANLTVNTKTFADPTTATEGQVLTLDNNNNMIWSNTGTGTVSPSDFTANQQIVATGSSGNVSLNLNSTFFEQNTSTGNYVYAFDTNGSYKIVNETLAIPYTRIGDFWTVRIPYTAIFELYNNLDPNTGQWTSFEVSFNIPCYPGNNSQLLGLYNCLIFSESGAIIANNGKISIQSLNTANTISFYYYYQNQNTQPANFPTTTDPDDSYSYFPCALGTGNNDVSINDNPADLILSFYATRL